MGDDVVVEFVEQPVGNVDGRVKVVACGLFRECAEFADHAEFAHDDVGFVLCSLVNAFGSLS